MEFHQKIQELRKQKGLTQEELAETLFVSRTAVSKWESGRGYPNIESLKAIAKFFGVTVDSLLSGEELLTVAGEDVKQKERRLRDLLYGLLDCSAALFFFLPLFGQIVGERIAAVSLLELSGISEYLKIAYFAFAIVSVIFGIATLALQNCSVRIWVNNKSLLSLLISAAGAMLFIISQQPYAAMLLFVFLIIKAVMLIKRQ